MRRRWRVRELNFRLPSFQISYSLVSFHIKIPLFFNKYFFFFRKKVETVIHSDNSFATVAFLRIKDAVLEAKPEKSLSAFVPPLLADQYKAVRDAILSSHHRTRTAELPSVEDQQALIFSHSTTMATSSLQRNNWVTVSNVQAHSSLSESNMTFEEEVIKCFQTLTGRFYQFYARLLLKSLSS